MVFPSLNRINISISDLFRTSYSPLLKESIDSSLRKVLNNTLFNKESGINCLTISFIESPLFITIEFIALFGTKLMNALYGPIKERIAITKIVMYFIKFILL